MALVSITAAYQELPPGRLSPRSIKAIKIGSKKGHDIASLAGIRGKSKITQSAGDDGLKQQRSLTLLVFKGPAEHLYEDVYCHRGQMENLIKLHKAQIASGRMSCHSTTANQARLALYTAAYWLTLAVRDTIPQTDPLAKAGFATTRERLIKIGARVVEHLARIRIQLPTSYQEGGLFRTVALRLAPSSG